MNPYTYERLAEERDHLMAMPGINKRRDADTVKRLEQINRELSKEGGKRRTHPSQPAP